MNEIKIYLKTSGRIAELYKDFDLYEGCYRNSQMSVYVPKSLLYENEDGTFANLVKTGAILTAPNGKKLTTKSYYLDYVKTETVVGIAYAVYTITTPKEFCVYAGTQTVVVNVESIDNTDKDNQKVISVTTTQTANLIVLESAYLGQDEPIEPTELDKIKATLTEIEGDITGLQSKVSDISDKVSTLSDVTTELMSDVDNLSIQVSDLSEDKLDKQSGATAYEEAYVKDTDGSQKMERVTITSIASAIVKRDANGNINIAKGLSGNPKNGANMENIADVEEKISKCPTLAGNNDFTGENTFEEAIQAKKGTVVKNSLDETNYNAGYISRNDWTYLFPADSGTFALTKNIPTDYATQTALANTQRQVDGLYTLLEQKNEIYVQTATDTYTTRETAGGENIADGVQTPVKKITGKTVKTTNLFNLNATPIRKVNATLSTTGDTFIATATSVNANVCFEIAVSIGQQYTISLQSLVRENPGGMGSAEYLKSIFISSTSYADSADYGYLSEGNDVTFTAKTEFVYIQFYVTYSFDAEKPATISVTGLQLNEGSAALPYMPYFSGLKNAFFKEIVSTGRNLIPYPYNETTVTKNGITFTVNNDGTINVNGTATDGDALFYLVSAYNLSLSEESYFSGCPAGGSSSSYLLQAYTPASRYYSDTGSGFLLPANIDVAVVLVVKNGYTANNLVFKPILNYGSSALPYEPYTQSVLSLPEAVENGKWNTIDIENGKNISQGFTKTFDGTEEWNIFNVETVETGYTLFRVEINPRGDSNTNNLLCTNYPFVAYNWSVKDGKNSISIDTDGVTIIIKQKQYMTISDWKTYLAALHTSGNPLVVRYKTREIQSETDISPSADSYIAWKNGSETIKQGDTDNSEYGAENTVEQDYYLLTAPQEVTKE